MKFFSFIDEHWKEIKQKGVSVLFRKLKRLILLLIILLPGLIFVLISRIISKWILFRWSGLISNRIGHFGLNTELYLCEIDSGINTPKVNFRDLFFYGDICNKQLAVMWRRILHIYPEWILAPIVRLNRLIPGWKIHEVGNNTNGARDVLNLFDKTLPHLTFNQEEIFFGEKKLESMGIKEKPFVCLIVRDSAYLSSREDKDWSYHNYRDCNIQNFQLAAETYVANGSYMIRMGAKVNAPLVSSDAHIIDYATNGMRNDFMDIFLGAYCKFCISTATGWEAIPTIFRRPIVFVNMAPVGLAPTSRQNVIFIIKKAWLKKESRFLTLKEIFQYGIGFSTRTSDFESRGIELIENSPEEIRDVVMEMENRLNGSWIEQTGDLALQKRFKEIFTKYAVEDFNGLPLHGEVRARYGADFLRQNPWWLD